MPRSASTYILPADSARLAGSVNRWVLLYGSACSVLGCGAGPTHPRLPPPPTSRAELRVTTRRRAYGMSAAVVFPYGLALPGRPGAGSALGLVSARPAGRGRRAW